MTVRIATLRRYAVKSTAGEELDRAEVEPRGLAGDRSWAVLDADGKLGSGKSTRRFRKMPGLLDLASRYDGDVPVLTFPDGTRVRGDDPAVHDRLSAHVGRPVTLAREAEAGHHDEGPLHLVTTETLDRLGADGGLLRANLVLDAPGTAPFAEDGWCGRLLEVGDEVVLAVREPMPRCVMVGSAVLHAATELNHGCAGVVLDVVVPGTVRVGDAVRLTGRAAAR